MAFSICFTCVDSVVAFSKLFYYHYFNMMGSRSDLIEIAQQSCGGGGLASVSLA